MQHQITLHRPIERQALQEGLGHGGAAAVAEIACDLQPCGTTRVAAKWQSTIYYVVLRISRGRVHGR